MIAKKFSGKVQKKIHWCSTWTTTIFRKRFSVFMIKDSFVKGFLLAYFEV